MGLRLHQHLYWVMFRIFRSRFLQHNAAKEVFVFWRCLHLVLAEDFGSEQATFSRVDCPVRVNIELSEIRQGYCHNLCFLGFLLNYCLSAFLQSTVQTRIPFNRCQCNVIAVRFYFVDILYTHLLS